MKNLLFLAAVLIVNFSWAQNNTSYGNFKLVDQEIIYQKVFEQDSITPEKLEAYYKTLSYVSNVAVKGDGVEFDVNDMTVDYKKFQFSQVATPAMHSDWCRPNQLGLLDKAFTDRLQYKSTDDNDW